MSSYNAEIEMRTVMESWTVNELIDAISPNPFRDRKVTIPEFQRRLVWGREKQDELIESVKRGYPFGSLLMYRKPDVSGSKHQHYQLIDGLQRTQALRKYANSPNSGFSRADLSDELIELIAQELSRSAKHKNCLSKTKKIHDIILRWVRDRRGFTEADGWGIEKLAHKLISELFELESGTPDFQVIHKNLLAAESLFRERVVESLASIQKRSDISDVSIPIIIFKGQSSELPRVFELLNTQGTKLTRYEVFAAQWLDYRGQIENFDIIEAIWRKYEALEKEGFTLDIIKEAPDKPSRRVREYTFFEYLFGLGQYLTHRYPQLFKPVEVDQPGSVGFNLMTACVGLHIQDMDELPENITFDRLSSIEASILEATQFVDKILYSVLSTIKHNKSKIPIYHTQYQIISMIATAFHIRYDYKNNLSERDGWEAGWGKLEKDKHLLMYYLYDILRDYWSGTGDTTLYGDVNNLRYLNPPPAERTWIQGLDAWFLDKQMHLLHTGRYIRDQNPEILLLKYIYVHKLSDVKNAQDYQIEHIIPINQFQSLMDKTEKWPINSIGNLALLEKGKNLRKGSLTFDEYLRKLRDDGKITYQQYSTELPRYEEQLICKAKHLPTEITKNSFEDFLFERFELLKAEFIKVWREYIPVDNSRKAR